MGRQRGRGEGGKEGGREGEDRGGNLKGSEKHLSLFLAAVFRGTLSIKEAPSLNAAVLPQ